MTINTSKLKVKTWYTSKNEKVVETGLAVRLNRDNCIDFDFKCNLFLEHCEENDIPLTLTRLLLYLGVTKEIFDDYLNVEVAKENIYTDKKFRRDLCRRMLMEIEANRLEGALTGKQQSQASLADLKENHGWKDKQTVETNVSMGIDVRRLYELVQEVEEKEAIEAKKATIQLEQNEIIEIEEEI